MKWAFLMAMTLVVTMGVGTSNAGAQVRKPTAAAQSSTISDVVKKMRADEEGIVILFTKNAGSYYLKNGVADFDSLRKKLEDSLNGKKTVSVKADSSLNILEVK